MSNVKGLKTNRELYVEVRDQEIHKMDEYKEKTKIYLGKKARVKEYDVGDLGLWDTKASYSANRGKLQPN